MYKLIAETKLPKGTRTRPHDLKALLDDIVYKQSKFVKFEFGPDDYKNAHSAFVNLKRAIIQYGHPLRVHKCSGEIHFERTDM